MHGEVGVFRKDDGEENQVKGNQRSGCMAPSMNSNVAKMYFIIIFSNVVFATMFQTLLPRCPIRDSKIIAGLVGFYSHHHLK